MNGPPAVSARMLGRGFALFAAGFTLVCAASCGRETFDLLPPTPAVSGGPGSPDGAGGNNVAGPGGSAGFSGVGGLPTRPGAGGVGGASGGSAQGGSDGPCFPGQSCVDGGVSCPPTVDACKRCSSSLDCGRDGLPYCQDGRCVECLPGKNACRPGENCDPTFLRCAKACMSTQDCAIHEFCALSRNVCVDCVSSSDCAAVAGHEKYFCAGGFCVECFDNSSCTDLAKPICQQLHCVAR